MICRVKLFARARDLAQRDVIEVTLPTGATIADLRRILGEEHPKLREILKHSALAVGTDFAHDEMKLTLQAEVALLPPVSGG